MTLLLPIPPDRYDVDEERERNRLIEEADRESVKRNRSTTFPDDVYLGAEIRDRGGMVFNVKHPEFGAVGDGASNDTAAIGRALTALTNTGGGTIVFPPGVYVVSSVLTIGVNDAMLWLDPDAEIRSTSSTNVIAASGRTNVGIMGGLINGGDTGSHAVAFTTCTNAHVVDVEIKEAGAIGVKFDGCTRSTIRGCHLHNNSSYGFEDEGGLFNLITENHIHDNGRPQGGDNITGRGLVLWKSTYCSATNNLIHDNTEYGIRVYSESGDGSGAKYNTIAHNILQDNGDSGSGAIEIYLYDESGLIESNKVFCNTIVKTVSRGQFISVQGDHNEVCHNEMIATADDQSVPGIFLFGATSAVIDGNRGFGVSNLVGFSGSTSPSNCAIINNRAFSATACVGTPTGSGHIRRSNTLDSVFVEFANGTATVANGTTSIAVTHGLGVTPALSDISVTPTNNLGTAAKFWISSPTSTQFTINVDADPGATTATFAWTASVQ